MLPMLLPEILKPWGFGAPMWPLKSKYLFFKFVNQRPWSTRFIQIHGTIWLFFDWLNRLWCHQCQVRKGTGFVSLSDITDMEEADQKGWHHTPLKGHTTCTTVQFPKITLLGYLVLLGEKAALPVLSTQFWQKVFFGHVLCTIVLPNFGGLV